MRIRSPEPGLPVDSAEVRRWWVFAADVLPGWPVRAWDRATSSALPRFLGDPPFAGVGELVVSQSPVEVVRVGTVQTANATGFGIAALFLALAWAGGRRRHPLCGLMMVGVLLAVGVASLLGPPWWQQAGAVPLFVGLAAAGVMVVVRGQKAVAPVVAVAVGLVVLFQLDTQAQAPVPAIVVILPTDADGREMVASPKAVLDRLAAAALPKKPGVILSAASYLVTADDARGEWSRNSRPTF